MGAGLCGDAKPPPPPPPQPSNPNKTRPTKVNVKSPERVAVQTHKRVNEEEDKRGSVTLEDCLVKPPNNNIGEHAMNPTKLQVVDAISQQSQVTSLPEVRNITFHSPNISVSSENATGKLDKVDGRDDDDDDDEKKSKLRPVDGPRRTRPRSHHVGSKTRSTSNTSGVQDQNSEPLLQNHAPQALGSKRRSERDDDKDDEKLINPILKRFGSQKLDKTVTFRENDIFFFYSPVTFLEGSR